MMFKRLLLVLCVLSLSGCESREDKHENREDKYMRLQDEVLDLTRRFHVSLFQSYVLDAAKSSNPDINSQETVEERQERFSEVEPTIMNLIEKKIPTYSEAIVDAEKIVKTMEYDVEYKSKLFFWEINREDFSPAQVKMGERLLEVIRTIKAMEKT